MQRLYEARDRIEAQILVDFLAGHHIQAVILGDYLAGAAGELPVNIFPTVWVIDDADEARAKGLLARYRRGEFSPDAASWTCPRCGETVEGSFEVCWNCGTARP